MLQKHQMKDSSIDQIKSSVQSLYLNNNEKTEPLDLVFTTDGPETRLDDEILLSKTPPKAKFVKIFELFNTLEASIQRICSSL